MAGPGQWQGQGSGRAREYSQEGARRREGAQQASRQCPSFPCSPGAELWSTGRKHPHRGEGAAGKFKAYKSLKRMKKMLETNEVLFSALDKIILGNK